MFTFEICSVYGGLYWNIFTSVIRVGTPLILCRTVNISLSIGFHKFWFNFVYIFPSSSGEADCWPEPLQNHNCSCRKFTGLLCVTGSFFSMFLRGFIKFLCRRSVGFFSRAFLVLLMKGRKKRRWKQPGKLTANSRTQPVILPGARPLMNILKAYTFALA